MSSKRIFLSPPSVDQRERELLLEAFDSNWIVPLGPCVFAFEKALAIPCHRKSCAALSSGTFAIHLAHFDVSWPSKQFLLAKKLK